MTAEVILRMAKAGVCPVCGGRARKVAGVVRCTTESFGMRPCGWTLDTKAVQS